MPTVHRQGGFEVRIYPDDHLPPHVHVFKGGKEVVIYLGSDDERPSIRERRGMSDRDAAAAIGIATAYQDDLLVKWREIHG